MEVEKNLFVSNPLKNAKTDKQSFLRAPQTCSGIVGSVFSHSVSVPFGDNSYYFCLFFHHLCFIFLLLISISLSFLKASRWKTPSPITLGSITARLYLGVCIMMTLLSVFMLMLLQSIFFQMVSSYHIYCTFFFDFLFLIQCFLI